MELRELVLSTLEELDTRLETETKRAEHAESAGGGTLDKGEEERTAQERDDEVAFLKHTKERLEVLFRGLHSPEIKDGEAKLELTLKYLQLLLAQVDERLAQRER